MTMNDAVDAEQTEKLLAPLRHELLHPIEDMQDENDRQFTLYTIKIDNSLK